MKNLNKLYILFLIALLVTFGAGTALGASKFPEQPITIIVQSGAGGGSDIQARMVAMAMEKHKLLPQPIVVENMPGGSGGKAYAYLAGKTKNPYYLGTATSTFITTPLIGQSPVGHKDFTPIANLAFDEYVPTVNADSKYKSMKDIIADAKANPRKINVGGTQIGTGNSICSYLIEKVAGVELNYVAFPGFGEVSAALLGKHIDIAMSNPGESIALYKAGRVRYLGIFSEKRMAGLSEVPTMKEQGINAVFNQNRGFFAPAGIPADARKLLEEAFLKFMQTETFKTWCANDMMSEAWMDGPTFGKWLETESVKYAVWLKDMGLIKKK